MTTRSSSTVITELEERLKQDTALCELLLESLEVARANAKSSLEPKLYKALDWPITVGGYSAFLTEFSRWTPQQSSDPAWTDPGTDEQQEVYDRLCHFHFLIDQPVGPDKDRMVQNQEWFSNWLVAYANLWGTFLDTTDSFSNEILQSFIDNSPKYRVQDSLVNGKPNAPSGWLTFNQFFARELNPGLRPISSPGENTTVVSPADCTYRNHFPIRADSSIEEICVKKTHKFANVKDLLLGSEYGDAFANGTFVHYFLGPYSYHRFHSPVAGLLRECRAIQGLVYLDVNLKDGQFDAPDSSTDAYEFSQARGIYIIDTADSPAGNVGLIGVVPVGMCQVSSVHMTAVPGNNVGKGEEFGYFLFGGSDIIVLFQEGVDPELDLGSNYRYYGTPIAHCKQR